MLDVVSAVHSCKNLNNAIQHIRSVSSAVLVISRLGINDIIEAVWLCSLVDA